MGLKKKAVPNIVLRVPNKYKTHVIRDCSVLAIHVEIVGICMNVEKVVPGRPRRIFNNFATKVDGGIWPLPE